ncbi:MAG: 4Fe-4S binding protein [Rhodoferax sp.]|nr:4Fe-4S binding protein [Rhodoferax sp.]
MVWGRVATVQVIRCPFGRWLVGAVLSLFVSSIACAGVMTKETLAQAFPAPLIIGDKDTALPVWPIFKQELTSTPLIGYAFESIDLAPIPGFSGTPFNLLVALNANGDFMDVQVLSQHEPVFLEGLGPEPMLRFVEQYKGLSLKQNIKIGGGQNNGGNANVVIQGVAKATASVRILNQSLLSSSLKVARAKMGYAQGRDPDLIARIKPEVMDILDWDKLLSKGLVSQKTFSNREVNMAFAGTAAEDSDAEGRAAPDAVFETLYATPLHVPTVGRNLLSQRDWDYLQGRLEPGDSALLVMAKGRYSMLGDEFTRGAVPSRITLRQGELPLELRDLDIDLYEPLRVPEALKDAEWKIFRVIAPAGLDPSLPLEFSLRVIRTKGEMYGERVGKDFMVKTELPDRYFEAAQSDNKTWHSLWMDRWWELVVLAAGLVVLTWALRKPTWLTQSMRRLNRFRTAYMLFTLGFIGWYAQGQLSIVNLTGVVRALVEQRSLGFFLYDPMTVLLWAFTAVTFFAWGRATFCGWLCPFGALQELIGNAARALKVPQIRLSLQTDQRLKKLKYLVLAVIMVSALVSVTWTDRLVEVEPFKTSITLLFVRSWPFVAWAVALLVVNAVIFKSFCRYLCPLGAGMALLGRLRLKNWIPRRVECGQPCQRCASDCRYQSIEKSGAVDYVECFQCLDCVAIEQSSDLCVPKILDKKRSTVLIPIHPVKGA